MKPRASKGKARGQHPGLSIHYEARGVIKMIALSVKVVLIFIGTIELTLLIRKMR